MTALFWLLSTLFWTSVLSFCSMQEMACISFNRLRLELAVRSNSRRDVWIKRLIDRPTTLFGTTLIGVNVALVMSSESIRRLFCELTWNPNLSLIILAPYIIIFGELIPMFAARAYSEHIARIGSPLLYAASILLSPIAFMLDTSFRCLLRLFIRSEESSQTHLQRDELKELIEEQAEGEYFDETTGQLEPLANRIFLLKEKSILQLLTPVRQLADLPSTALCGPTRAALLEQDEDMAVVHNRQNQIIGYVLAWDLVKAADSASVGSFCRMVAPLVDENTPIIDVLFRLRKEDSAVAFVVGPRGEVLGTVTIDDIVSEITKGTRRHELHLHIEKTIPADTPLAQFADRYHLTLPKTQATTLGSLVEELLGHTPAVHDTVRFGGLEMVVKEVSLRGAKSLFIRT